MNDYKRLKTIIEGLRTIEKYGEMVIKPHEAKDIADTIEELFKEHDIAIKHLRRIADCLSCKYNRFYAENDSDTYCIHPHQSRCEGKYWEWRGVQEVEHDND